MEKILLSDESYRILQDIERLSPVPAAKACQYSESCMKHLLENGLIEYHATAYDTSGEWMIPTESECIITEKGTAYLVQRRNEEETLNSIKSMAASAEEQANAARIQAELAIQAAADAKTESEKARRDARFSKIISVAALLVAFFEPFLATYAREIVESLLQLFS